MGNYKDMNETSAVVLDEGTAGTEETLHSEKTDTSPEFDYHDEMIQIEMLFQSHILSFGYKEYSLETYSDKRFFENWKAREGCSDTDEMRAGLNIDGILRSADPSESEVLTYLQYTLNIAELCRRSFNKEEAVGYDFDIRNYTELLSRIRAILRKLSYEVKYVPEKEFIYIVPHDAAAEAATQDPGDPVTSAITQYRSTSLTGNLDGKRQLLLELGKKIESFPDNLKKEHSVLFSRIEFMLSHVNIREDNAEGEDRVERVALMSADEMEHWYDETYQLMLLRILEHQNEERLAAVDELADQCGIGISEISEEEITELLNAQGPDVEDIPIKIDGPVSAFGTEDESQSKTAVQKTSKKESGSTKRAIIAIVIADVLFVLFILCWLILFNGV